MINKEYNHDILMYENVFQNTYEFIENEFHG